MEEFDLTLDDIMINDETIDLVSNDEMMNDEELQDMMDNIEDYED